MDLSNVISSTNNNAKVNLEELPVTGENNNSKLVGILGVAIAVIGSLFSSIFDKRHK